MLFLTVILKKVCTFLKGYIILKNKVKRNFLRHNLFFSVVFLYAQKLFSYIIDVGVFNFLAYSPYT